jgi:hypothetical protein
MNATEVSEWLLGMSESCPQLVGVYGLNGVAWLVALDDDTELVVETLDAPARLMLSAAIGRPPVDRMFLVYENLLCFNSLWRDHLGTWLALDGAEGELMAIHEVDATELTPQIFQDRLLAFAALAAQWQQYVTLPAGALRIAAPLGVSPAMFA